MPSSTRKKAASSKSYDGALSILIAILILGAATYFANSTGDSLLPSFSPQTQLDTMSSFSLNKALFNPVLYARIREIWFAGIPPSNTMPTWPAMMRWFGQVSPEEKEQLDNDCRSTVAEALASVDPSHYPLPPVPKTYDQELAQAATIAAPWSKELDNAGGEEERANMALSMVLMFDQFPRNAFRKNQTLIYTHYDRIARSIVRDILSRNPRPDEHSSLANNVGKWMWFTLPLVHSEFLQDHALKDKLDAVAYKRIKEAMEEQGDEEGLKGLAMLEEKGGESGKQHAEILEKFGRYPYRNAAMGRETTAEEKKWIEEGGPTFGAGAGDQGNTQQKASV